MSEQEVVYGSSYRPYSKQKLSDYWINKYEHDAEVYWDRFYKSNEDKFFKDRHYLDREFEEFKIGSQVILEIGCGVGNSTLPLLDINPDLFFYSFDFSKKALQILIDKAREGNTEEKISVFHWDPANYEYPTVFKYSNHKSIIPAENTCDLGLIVFVLSAISPDKMVSVMKRTSRYIKPGGSILVRDYAVDDMAHKRFLAKGDKSKLEDNFYVRGDGTRAYYFTEEFMQQLCADCEVFSEVQISFIEKDVCNRDLDLTMTRRFIQAKFILKMD